VDELTAPTSNTFLTAGKQRSAAAIAAEPASFVLNQPQSSGLQSAVSSRSPDISTHPARFTKEQGRWTEHQNFFAKFWFLQGRRRCGRKKRRSSKDKFILLSLPQKKKEAQAPISTSGFTFCSKLAAGIAGLAEEFEQKRRHLVFRCGFQQKGRLGHMPVHWRFGSPTRNSWCRKSEMSIERLYNHDTGKRRNDYMRGCFCF
jgi:hypothetical protein